MHIYMYVYAYILTHTHTHTHTHTQAGAGGLAGWRRHAGGSVGAHAHAHMLTCSVLTKSAP